jgi:peptide/nickel transport system substrate-binding protein
MFALPTRTLALSASLVFGLGLAAQAAPLRYAEDRAPGVVNPAFATSMSEARVNELVFEGLYTDSTELASVPRLAAEATLSPDKRAMRIRLRTDVKWHDGTPFTSTDVVFTIDALKNTQTASPEVGRVTWIESARAIDRHTVELRFVAPEFAPQDKLHFKILPAHRFDGPVIPRTHPFRNRPIGTGPWAVVSFNDDNSITMQRWRDYWGDARIDEFVMREVADKNYQSKLLLYESIEALVRVLPRDLATLQNDRKVELFPYQTNSWWYVGFNQQRAPFDDPRVRKAITLLVDIPELLAPIGTGDRVSGPFVPSSPFYNHDVPPRTRDVAAAKALLTEAGFTWDGRYWTRGGKRLSLTIATQKNLETAQDVVVNLQSQLLNQGIAVEPKFLELPDWKQKIWTQRDYDMALSLWTFDRNEDIHPQFHSKGARNFTGYKNPKVDELLDRARGTTDPQEKKVLMRQVHALVAADDPMIFLWTLDSYAAMTTRAQGVVVHPFYFFTFAPSWSLR